jgi:hypothetical protein
MKRVTVGAFAVAMLVSTGVFAGDGLKSGPPVGSSKITPFNPLHCSGAGEGGKACLV